MKISTHTILKVLTVTALFVGLIYCMYLTRTILVWIVAAFSLALALNPAVSWVQRKIPRHNRIVATLGVFGILFGVLSILALSLVPPVVSQTEQLIRNLPAYTDQISRPGTAVGDFIIKYDLINQIQNSQEQLVGRLTNASGTFVGIVTSLFSSILAMLSILGLTIFMIMEGPGWIKMFWTVQTPERREHGQELAGEMYKAVVGYVNGKLLAAFLAGLSAAIALLLFHVPYAAALALVIGLFSIIPVFGASVGAVIVVGACLVIASTPVAIGMAIFFFVYQQIENNIIQPVIFQRAVDVSPLLVFISVLVGTVLGGILGALIAIPVTASFQILVRDYYSHKSKMPVHVAKAGKLPVKA